MITSKFKSIQFLVVLFAAFTLILSSCSKEANERPDYDIPQAAVEQLETSKTVWNEAMGDALTLDSYTGIKPLNTQADINDVINKLADPHTLVGHGNILEPSTVAIGFIGDVKEEDWKISKQVLIDFTTEAIQVGDVLVEINWKKAGATYQTLCIVRESGIVWDNILTGVIAFDTEGVTEESPLSRSEESSKVYSKWSQTTWTGNWIWGGKRGSMGYRITIYYSGSYVSNTDRSDWASMTLGSTKSESRVLKNSGSYGKVQYALGISTPLASLSFNHTYFTVSSGGIGSKMVRNGTKSLYP